MMKLDRPIIFFDLETTGVDLEKDRIVQIAMIKIMPNKERIEKTSLIDPEMKIPEKASAIHGITSDMVIGKPTFKQIGNALKKFFDDSDIGGYNSNRFDLQILMKEFTRAGVKFNSITRNYVDVLTLEKILNPRDLSTIYNKYTGKELKGAHDALVDVKATIEIFKHQLKNEKLKSLKNTEEIDEMIKHEMSIVDFSGKLKMLDGEVVWNFGKHYNKPVFGDLSYCNWFLGKETFPEETKQRILKLAYDNKINLVG